MKFPNINIPVPKMKFYRANTLQLNHILDDCVGYNALGSNIAYDSKYVLYT